MIRTCGVAGVTGRRRRPTARTDDGADHLRVLRRAVAVPGQVPPGRREGRRAGGPVPIRVVDPTQHPKIAPYVSPGTFFLIPVSPLRSHARYTATVTVAGPNSTQTKTWHFTTA